MARRTGGSPDSFGELDVGSLTEISVFSGYGGFSLGLRLAGIDVRTVCYVENDPYCQRIINQRIADGHLDDAPLWDDIKTFDGRPWRGCVDIITGGFPCQDLSTAGKRVGLDGERSGLWGEMLRCVREVGPRYVLIENVPGILVGGQAGTVVGELSGLGYDSVWHCVPAAAVGAPHLRWRWWCLAYAISPEVSQQQGGRRCVRSAGLEPRGQGEVDAGRNGQDWDVANTNHPRPQGRDEAKHPERASERIAGESRTLAHSANGSHEQSSTWSDVGSLQDEVRSSGRHSGYWEVEPPLGRVADGVANRVGQLRALGNGIVPAVVAEFLRMD